MSKNCTNLTHTSTLDLPISFPSSSYHQTYTCCCSAFQAVTYGPMYGEMRCTLPPHPNTSSAPRFLLPLPPWCFHSRSGGIHRNLVPMSHCCPKSVAVAPMGEKIKDAFQSNPLIHTHIYKYTKSTSSHPLPPSIIKGISIETLMKGAHFKGNTFQTLHEKIHRQHGLL